jgi:hypothetical protein
MKKNKTWAYSVDMNTDKHMQSSSVIQVKLSLRPKGTYPEHVTLSWVSSNEILVSSKISLWNLVLEKLTVSQLVKKCSVFNRIWIFIIVFRRARQWVSWIHLTSQYATSSVRAPVLTSRLGLLSFQVFRLKCFAHFITFYFITPTRYIKEYKS